VLIADRDGLARNMMQAALQDTAIVLTAANAREALALTRYYHPTVAIIDTALPPNGSVELIGQLLATAPHTQILTVSIDDQPTAIAGLRAGAIGHITKDTNPDHLANLITKAANGDTIIPPPLTKALLQLAREIPDAGWRPLHSRLTTREWEIAELLRDNTTTRQIADRLVLAPTTVHSHIKSLLRKLDIHSRRDAYPAARRLRHTEVWNQTPPPTPTPQAPHPPTKKH
jgi:DNA-binding NarL/FixJ family response regulator